MPDAPDSLLTAARKLAVASGLPWHKVQKVYATLQSVDLLPVSQGRAVWHAHPNMMVSLIVALAVRHEASTPGRLKETVELFRLAGKDGGGFEGEWLQTAMMHFLTDRDAASSLVSIVFEPDTLRAVITRRDGADYYFHEVDEVQRDGSVVDATHAPGPLIQTRGVVHGDVFRALQASVAWNLSGWPTRAAGADDEAEA